MDKSAHPSIDQLLKLAQRTCVLRGGLLRLNANDFLQMQKGGLHKDLGWGWWGLGPCSPSHLHRPRDWGQWSGWGCSWAIMEEGNVKGPQRGTQGCLVWKQPPLNSGFPPTEQDLVA
jgi:hypothetical protein